MTAQEPPEPPPAPAPAGLGQLPVPGFGVDARPEVGQPEFGRPVGPPSWRARLRSLIGPLIAIGFLLLKFGKAAFVALKFSKFGATTISMFVSVAAYQLLWGWPFAVGFVLLILVHEMGHVIQLRREGVAASAPMFIPFLGAAVAMKGMPRNAYVEAKVGLAGPILGTAGAVVVFWAAQALGNALLRDLATVGFLINLFNMLPITPLDGGRAMAAVSPALWFVGLALLAAYAAFVSLHPVVVLILLFGVLDLWSRWRRRREEADYYRQVTREQRFGVLGVYVGLVIAMLWFYDQSFVPREIPS